MKLEVGDPITVAWWDTAKRDWLTVSRALVVGPRRSVWPPTGAVVTGNVFDVVTESGLLVSCRQDGEGTEWIRGHFPDDAEDVRSLSATALLTR